MKTNNYFKNNKKNTSLFILKNLILIFFSMIVYQCVPSYWANTNKIYGNISITTICFSLSIFILIYLVFLLFNIYIIYKPFHLKIFNLADVLFYNIIIALPIFLSHNYQSDFKYVFLLIIILSVIQYGIRYGVISSLISAIFILSIDTVYAPTINNINSYLEKDMILVGVFILVAWILGYYVELENENKREKDKQLNILCTELKEQSTQRNNIEEQLLKNNICFDMLIENSENAILVHKDGKIIYANESAVKLFGCKTSSELSSTLIYQYCDKKSEEKYSNIINMKLSKIVEEETILNTSKESIAVRNTSSFFSYEGNPAILTFLLDIRAEKQLEALKNDAEKNLKLLNETKEFNVLITEFFTNISHEIKTPLNIIYLAIQSLNIYFNNYSIDNEEKCKKYLKTMKQNCYRMIRLVNNLLDMTRSDSGFMKPNKSNHNIVSVVEDITQSVATYIKSKNINLIFDTNVEEKYIAIDEDKIERIMLNLLSNAFKYTPSNGTIMVTLEDTETTIVIKVKNSGKGIPKEKLDVIFERFGQANRSLSREHEGTGIGLYLVKSFVEMHNGKITVKSIENKETEFTITLPVEVSEDQQNNINNNVILENNVERINIEFSDIYEII
ncbi:MAG: PAS domain-containing sensor histidine kinase [Bacillota bacterium]|nr:PAS domain-containing sensor histidine kinase [Bacillota bacterium]